MRSIRRVLAAVITLALTFSGTPAIVGGISIPGSVASAQAASCYQYVSIGLVAGYPAGTIISEASWETLSPQQKRGFTRTACGTTPSPAPTATATAVPTPIVTAAPTSAPTAVPTAVPTGSTPSPTQAPTASPTPTASPVPTVAPTPSPTPAPQSCGSQLIPLQSGSILTNCSAADVQLTNGRFVGYGPFGSQPVVLDAPINDSATVTLSAPTQGGFALQSSSGSDTSIAQVLIVLTGAPGSTATPAPSAPTATPTAVAVVTPPPTVAPTQSPATPSPTLAPTQAPTQTPTQAPTVAPTATPVPATPKPTLAPTATPIPATPTPTIAPTATPTVAPTTAPTATPVPTQAPTVTPTAPPASPTPTAAPTGTNPPPVAIQKVSSGYTTAGAYTVTWAPTPPPVAGQTDIGFTDYYNYGPSTITNFAQVATDAAFSVVEGIGWHVSTGEATETNSTASQGGANDGYIYSFTGADSQFPVGAEASNTGNAAAVSCPAVTAPRIGSVIVYGIAIDGGTNGAGNQSPTVPSGYVSDGASGAYSAEQYGFHFATTTTTANQAVPGLSIALLTNSSTKWVCWSAAIQPPPPSGVADSPQPVVTPIPVNTVVPYPTPAPVGTPVSTIACTVNCVQPSRAREWTGAMGVNTHAIYGQYSNAAALIAGLNTLGIRQVRDGAFGASNVTNYVTPFCAAGGHFISGTPDASNPLPAGCQNAVQNYNEPDANGSISGTWPQAVRSLQATNSQAAATNNIPEVVGFASGSGNYATAYQDVGSLEPYGINLADFHDYPTCRYALNNGYGGNAGYGNYGSFSSQAMDAIQQDPQHLYSDVTEFGYENYGTTENNGNGNRMSLADGGVAYIGGMFEMHASGVHRIYADEYTTSDPGFANFSLVENSGYVKPSGYGVGTFQGVLQDTGSNALNFATSAFPLTVTGADAKTIWKLVEKSDGSFWVVAHRATQGWACGGDTVDNATVNLTLTLGQGFTPLSGAIYYQPNAQGIGVASTPAISGSAITMPINDTVTEVEIAGPNPAAVAQPAVVPTLGPTPQPVFTPNVASAPAVQAAVGSNVDALSSTGAATTNASYGINFAGVIAQGDLVTAAFDNYINNGSIIGQSISGFTVADAQSSSHASGSASGSLAYEYASANASSQFFSTVQSASNTVSAILMDWRGVDPTTPIVGDTWAAGGTTASTTTAATPVTFPVLPAAARAGDAVVCNAYADQGTVYQTLQSSAPTGWSEVASGAPYAEAYELIRNTTTTAGETATCPTNFAITLPFGSVSVIGQAYYVQAASGSVVAPGTPPAPAPSPTATPTPAPAGNLAFTPTGGPLATSTFDAQATTAGLTDTGKTYSTNSSNGILNTGGATGSNESLTTISTGYQNTSIIIPFVATSNQISLGSRHSASNGVFSSFTATSDNIGDTFSGNYQTGNPGLVVGTSYFAKFDTTQSNTQSGAVVYTLTFLTSSGTVVSSLGTGNVANASVSSATGSDYVQSDANSGPISSVYAYNSVQANSIVTSLPAPGATAAPTATPTPAPAGNIAFTPTGGPLATSTFDAQATTAGLTDTGKTYSTNSSNGILNTGGATGSNESLTTISTGYQNTSIIIPFVATSNQISLGSRHSASNGVFSSFTATSDNIGDTFSGNYQTGNPGLVVGTSYFAKFDTTQSNTQSGAVVYTLTFLTSSGTVVSSLGTGNVANASVSSATGSDYVQSDANSGPISSVYAYNSVQANSIVTSLPAPGATAAPTTAPSAAPSAVAINYVPSGGPLANAAFDAQASAAGVNDPSANYSTNASNGIVSSVSNKYLLGATASVDSIEFLKFTATANSMSFNTRRQSNGNNIYLYFNNTGGGAGDTIGNVTYSNLAPYTLTTGNQYCAEFDTVTSGSATNLTFTIKDTANAQISQSNYIDSQSVSQNVSGLNGFEMDASSGPVFQYIYRPGTPSATGAIACGTGATALVTPAPGPTSTAVAAATPTPGPTASPALAFVSRPETCVDIYTAAEGNPACLPLFDANDSPVNGGPVADPSSSPWIAIQAQPSAAPSLSDVYAPTATQPGGAQYGQDAAQAMSYNPNGKNSTSTTGEVKYANLTCDPGNYSCGHSFSTASLWTVSGFTGQNPTSDHHVDALNQPCDPNGTSAPANKPEYTIAAGDRCELDTWLWQPLQPTAVPVAYVAGQANTATVSGVGQCDEDAGLGFYDCSGSTSSNMPAGLVMNPADLANAVANNTYLPYAILTAIIQTTGHYVFPSSYFDGYETSTTPGPPNGIRFWSDVTDAQVASTSWPAAVKAIMRTYHHMGGFIFDTTGGYGGGFSPQMIGGSGFTVSQTTDTTANDPILWLASTTNGGSGVQSISNNDAGQQQGLDIKLAIAPYSVAANFHFCARPSYDTKVSTVSAVPKTCGNL